MRVHATPADLGASRHTELDIRSGPPSSHPEASAAPLLSHMGRIRPTLGQSQAKSGPIFDIKSVEFGPTRSIFKAKFGRIWSDIGRIRPKLVDSRPNVAMPLVAIRPTMVAIRPAIDRPRPFFYDSGPTPADFDRFCPHLIKLGLNSMDFGSNPPSLGRRARTKFLDPPRAPGGPIL